MKAIVLAAGEGTRLRPHTLSRPKCLVEVQGKSLIERQIEVLQAEGIESIVIVTGYKGEMLERLPAKRIHNAEYADTNMVHSLFCAEAELEGDVIVSYGDIVFSREILAALIARQADVAVSVDLGWESYWSQRFEDPLSDAETLKMSPAGAIVELGQKPKSLNEIEGQYMGLMKFNAAGLGSLKHMYNEAVNSGSLGGRPVRKAYMTDMLQALIDSGQEVAAVTVQGGWIEVDTVEDLENEVTSTRLAAIARAMT